MEALDAPKVPLISTLLEMVLGLLAIAVKVHIADRLNGLEGRIRKLPPEGTPASSSDWPSGFDQGVTDVSRSSPPPSANAAAEIYRSGEGEYMKKVFRIFLAVTILLGVIPALGVEHKQGMASQHLNQYWAVREINTWFLFGVEIYANNRLAVYDMMDRTRDDLPPSINGPSVQVRRFGNIIKGDDQFNLGEDHYKEDRCLAYIRDALREANIE